MIPSVALASRAMRVTTALFLLLSGTACSRDQKTAASTDSALDRDLTLAAQSSPVPTPSSGQQTSLGDTAISSPSAPQKSAPPSSATPNRQNPPKKAPTPARVPSQPIPTPEKAPATVAAAPSAAIPTAPAASAPVEPASTGSANSAGAGAGRKSLGSGTVLLAQTSSQLCSLANRPGDRIVATLNSAVTGPDGAVLPAGTPIVVEMATAEPPADFAFRVKGVQVDGTFIPVEGRVTSDGATTDRRVSKGGDKGKVATGAVVGAILGRVLGGGTKGTVIGAAGGAAAGTVMAQRNSTVEHCLPSGASITVTLTSPLVLPGSTL